MISTIQKCSHFESGSGAALVEKWRLDRLLKGLSCMFPSPRKGRPRRCIPRLPSAPAGYSKNQAGEFFPPGHRDQEAKNQREITAKLARKNRQIAPVNYYSQVILRAGNGPRWSLSPKKWQIG
jgi:hypothetical protein